MVSFRRWETWLPKKLAIREIRSVYCVARSSTDSVERSEIPLAARRAQRIQGKGENETDREREREERTARGEKGATRPRNCFLSEKQVSLSAAALPTQPPRYFSLRHSAITNRKHPLSLFKNLSHSEQRTLLGYLASLCV